jgi:hypothetical protein
MARIAEPLTNRIGFYPTPAGFAIRISSTRNPQRYERISMEPPAPAVKSTTDPKVVFVKSYKHYRTGKIMNASDYGYTSWKFLPKK